MSKLTRVTSKVFGGSATATGDDPNIAQFGSAKAGTFIGTTDVATIQSLSAWDNGFIDAVTPNLQYPALPEFTGAMKVLSYQSAYNQQMGIAEWDSNTTYYINSLCQYNGEIFKSTIDDNQNIEPTDVKGDWVKPFNGQWVGLNAIVIANNVAVSTTTDTNYDLSNYIPNDGYKYEILISTRAISGSSSGNQVDLKLSTSEVPIMNILIGITRTSSTYQTACPVLLPIGTDRILTYNHATSTGTYWIWLNGYRRIGVNS